MKINNRLSNIIIFFSNNRRKIIVSCLIGIFIIISDYLISNISYPLLDSTDSLMWFNYFRGFDKNSDDEDVIFINVGFDKALVDIKDEFGDVIGNDVITDRCKLNQFLKIIKDSPYKYVFLDIRFEYGYESDCDSTLFETMQSMNNLVFSSHRDLESLVPESLESKSAFADYRGNFKDGFSRYEFIQDGYESVALRLFRDLDSGKMEKKGLLYLLNGRPCYNMLFIDFPYDATQYYGDDGRIKYPYLGSQILNNFTPSELRKTVSNKIVIIGDFENDIHQTYIGNIPGPLLSYYAYKSLADYKNVINPLCCISLFIIYFIITYNILGTSNINLKLCRLLNIKSQLGIYLFSLLGWTFVLFLMKIIVYLIWGINILIVIPAIIFSIISQYTEIKTLRKQS